LTIASVHPQQLNKVDEGAVYEAKFHSINTIDPDMAKCVAFDHIQLGASRLPQSQLFQPLRTLEKIDFLRSFEVREPTDCDTGPAFALSIAFLHRRDPSLRALRGSEGRVAARLLTSGEWENCTGQRFLNGN
jgi:hypothetical protein